MQLGTSGGNNLRRGFVLTLVVSTSIAFVSMVRFFIVPMLLAGLLAGATIPLFERLATRMGGARSLAAGAVVGLVFGAVALPVAALVALVSAQAVTIVQRAEVWVAAHRTGDGLDLRDVDAMLPALGPWQPTTDDLMIRAGEMASALGGWVLREGALVGTLTAGVVLDVFIMCYALFFFLLHGRTWLRRLLFLLPLHDREHDLLLTRVLAISRATVKGTLLIGVAQGALAGVAFSVAGVHAPVFWGVVMGAMSVVPGIGPSLVWIPASALLVLQGQVGAGLGLFGFCAAAVGTVDNVLRPRLVGVDAKLDDLTILVSTLGGLATFGAMGIVLGPMLAGIWVVVLDVYGSEFQDSLEPHARGEVPDVRG